MAARAIPASKPMIKIPILRRINMRRPPNTPTIAAMIVMIQMSRVVVMFSTVYVM